jgi:hypothetical protein
LDHFGDVVGGVWELVIRRQVAVSPTTERDEEASLNLAN